MNIKRTSYNDPDFLHLVDLLNRDFEEMYGSSKEKFKGENKLDKDAKIVVMYDDKKPVACGALKPIDGEGIGELKRMFVLPAYRGKGLSKLILSELETAAGESGYTTIRLKTGKKQIAAIALYEKAGYRFIKPYGGYKNIPDSVCMEKRYKQSDSK